MKMTFKLILFITFLLLIIGLVGCNSNTSDEAVTAVEHYLQALVAGDVNQLVDASCADWEENARLELDSFAAVTVHLEDLSCQESGQDGDYILVSCSGNIVANYGNEVLKINLADRIYQAISEGGDWRMCGYQ